ncbi:hypothetical protein [Phytoactinopolyspora endophytica]|uniref:hypothetical protein n=1 Tax=Phytoactinopolyspora endophytica TaxID=1642495 RepID=UPI00101B9E13|nr:hypothetical protein [Phytoactinopolyspora endophytica]
MITKTPAPSSTAIGDVGGLAGPAAGLLFTTAIAGAGRLAKDPFPGPGSSAEVIRTYYRGSTRAARFNVACQALSILAQSRYVVAMARVASRHRTHPRVLTGAVLVAGSAAVAALATSAVIQASLTVPKDDRTDDEVLATTRRVFLAGGPVHGVVYGAFTAATAVAAHNTRLLGRTGAVLGALSTTANLITPAYFRWEPTGWMIPIGRFSGYLLSGVIGARLATRRRR